MDRFLEINMFRRLPPIGNFYRLGAVCYRESPGSERRRCSSRGCDASSGWNMEIVILGWIEYGFMEYG